KSCGAIVSASPSESHPVNARGALDLPSVDPCFYAILRAPLQSSAHKHKIIKKTKNVADPLDFRSFQEFSGINFIHRRDYVSIHQTQKCHESTILHQEYRSDHGRFELQ